MARSSVTAVQRVHPPKAPFRVVNRLVRWLLADPRRARRVGEHLLVLHLTGRMSGRVLNVPVGYRTAPDGRLLILTSSTWRVNLRSRPQVEVTRAGVRRGARAELVDDPDAVARVYRELIEEIGPDRAGRRLGLRIRVDRTPTHAELVEAARRDGLSLVYLDVRAEA